jgi:hypothetical protein
MPVEEILLEWPELEGEGIYHALGHADYVAGFPRVAFAPVCFFSVFSGTSEPGLPIPGAERSSLNWGSISPI